MMYWIVVGFGFAVDFATLSICCAFNLSRSYCTPCSACCTTKTEQVEVSGAWTVTAVGTFPCLASCHSGQFVSRVISVCGHIFHRGLVSFTAHATLNLQSAGLPVTQRALRRR